LTCLLVVKIEDLFYNSLLFHNQEHYKISEIIPNLLS